jgi:hypothetical protein
MYYTLLLLPALDWLFHNCLSFGQRRLWFAFVARTGAFPHFVVPVNIMDSAPFIVAIHAPPKLAHGKTVPKLVRF